MLRVTSHEAFPHALAKTPWWPDLYHISHLTSVTLFSYSFIHSCYSTDGHLGVSVFLERSDEGKDSSGPVALAVAVRPSSQPEKVQTSTGNNLDIWNFLGLCNSLQLYSFHPKWLSRTMNEDGS